MGILAPICVQSITYLYFKSCFKNLFETLHVLRHHKTTELSYNYLLKFCHFYMPNSSLLSQFPQNSASFYLELHSTDFFKIVYGEVATEVHKIGLQHLFYLHYVKYRNNY